MLLTEAAFEKLYQRGRPPWDIEGPTPFVRELEQAGLIKGDVLDAGCGTGENALYLTSRGYHVTAFDASRTAIARATDKAKERGLDVNFQVADARQLSYESCFDTVIDSGLFHVFDEEDNRSHYAESLWKACRPGAVVHLLALAPTRIPGGEFIRRMFSPAGCGTHGVTERELRRAFGEGWEVESVSNRFEQKHSFRLARIRRL